MPAIGPTFQPIDRPPTPDVPEEGTAAPPRSLSLLDYSRVCGPSPCLTDADLDTLAGLSEAGQARAVAEQAMQGQSMLGRVGPFAVVAAPGMKGTPPPAPEPALPAATGEPRIAQITTDRISNQSTSALEARTGWPDRVGLAKGSLAGIGEVSVVSHGTTSSLAELSGEKVFSPRQLARAMVEAGWRGGTVRLVACHTGEGGTGSFAQRLANELARLGAPSGVIAPQGTVTTLGDVHGLPQVRTPDGAEAPRGKGWGYFVAEEGTGWRPALRPGWWKGAAVGLAGTAAMVAIGQLHARAVGERMRREVERTGWADTGPTGNRLYDLGAWFLDPTGEAARSVPFEQRFDMPRWRATMAAAADAKLPGETLSCRWTTSDGHDVLGRARFRDFTVIYVKDGDGVWSVRSTQDRRATDPLPDLNRIIDASRPDEEVRHELQLPSPIDGLA